jgi:carboxypeptidase Q
MFHRYRSLSLLLVAAVIPAFAADKTNTRPETSDKPAWQQPQPAFESVDLSMYARIREEGFQHSHIMEYASALTDGIGPRLTGSPNMAKANAWTRDQLSAMGCVNAHLDDWGEFGMGWQQLNTWVRMTRPTRLYSSRRQLPGHPQPTVQ